MLVQALVLAVRLRPEFRLLSAVAAGRVERVTCCVFRTSCLATKRLFEKTSEVADWLSRQTTTVLAGHIC